MIQSIWAYRNFILSSIKNEYQTRFARSKLGALWMVLHPLAQVAIYALILSSVLAAKLPGIDNKYAYAIYLMAGMLGWSLFAEVFNRCLTVFIDNGNLIKKMAFPRIALPLIVVGSGVLNNLLMLLAVVVIFGLLGHLPSLAFLWLPVLMLVTLALAIGMGLTLGIMNVFMRDIGQVAPVLIQFWFWLTPIVYMATLIPEAYRDLLMLNPMTGIVMSYQSVLVYNHAPDISVLLYPALVAFAFLALATHFYRQANEEMADVL
ncbi:MAG TPA: ABC transporter permease [Thiotrichales bacterium]|nr:MAG: ABC transporter [Sulfuricurvum sp. 24-42-5]HQR82944.1 ABC transporter permease [Thiotrichales bacterium]HQR95825.1 ABC transporter permease [Thiotrichales bacterium]